MIDISFFTVWGSDFEDVDPEGPDAPNVQPPDEVPPNVEVHTTGESKYKTEVNKIKKNFSRIIVV